VHRLILQDGQHRKADVAPADPGPTLAAPSAASAAPAGATAPAPAAGAGPAFTGVEIPVQMRCLFVEMLVNVTHDLIFSLLFS
jgi:3-oxoacyl-ACP reductase-like protein